MYIERKIIFIVVLVHLSIGVDVSGPFPKTMLNILPDLFNEVVVITKATNSPSAA